MNLTTARRVLGAVFVLALAGGTSTATWAAAPAAGTLIGNQATASYSDGGGNNFTATSGVVTSEVLQVAALTLTSSQTKSATQGQFVYFPHTLTNKGNGLDTFNLTLSAPGAGLDAPKVYIDNNANGQVDVGDTLVTSVQLAAGAQVALVVETKVLTAAGGNFNLTATSAHTSAQTASNTDTVTVVTGAVINVLKGISVTSGGPNTEITYTLTYQNTGNAAATNVILADAIPAGMTYKLNSGVVNTSQALTDAVDTLGAGETNTSGVEYQFNAAGNGSIAATIASVPVGGTGTIQFKVTVNPGVAAGIINNTGKYCAVGAASCNAGNVLTSGTPTNTVPFTVVQAASVVFNGAQATTGLTDGEEVTVAAANQGATVSFDDWVHNTGNAVDKFNITIDSNSFPVGTSFQIFKSDGATPLLDTNSDGIIDTGDLPINGAYKIVVKAVLPGNASAGGPYKVTLKATSVADSSKSDPVVNQLTTITANTVDLTNGGTLGQGSGVDGTQNSGNPITTKNILPGTSATFVLHVKGGTSPDTYTFSAWSDLATSSSVNANFTVAFYQDTSGGHDCSALGAQVSDTGNVAPGATSYFCGVVTSSPTTPATTQANVYFRIQSATTGTKDVKLDRVVVDAANAISLNPDNAQQAFPGGNVVYVHTLANNGNATESITLSKSDSGSLSSVIYVDDGNGTFGAEDTVYVPGTPVVLNQGQSRKVFVTVAVPANTPVGTSAVTTITALSATGATDSATDTTNVVGGFISLTKTGKNDVLCSGAVAGTAAQVKPNECIEYTVVATNIGSYKAEAVIINDVVPAYTAYSTTPSAASCTGSAGVASCSASEASGAVKTTAVDLESGQSVTLKFTVKVNPLAP